MADFPSFEEFFRAVRGGVQPFPWQRRLAALVVDEGWPDVIGVPTGLGKTSSIDIAVWSLAHDCAHHGPRDRRVPTRCWYVVQRRLLVDTAYEHARKLEALLADPESLREIWPQADTDAIGALRTVGQVLREAAGLGVADKPLYAIRLRGAAELGARPPDPSQPSLICATVGMFGSRFLFRGYGSSTSMRPVDAALAGTDSLLLLDEAHLARPLTKLLETSAKADLGDPTGLLPHGRTRTRLAALTATGEDLGKRFDLDAEDEAHPVVATRLAATKPTELRPARKKDLAEVLATAAVDLLNRRPGSACVVFCNTVALARSVADRSELTKRPATEVRLLTGRIREREAQAVREFLLDPATGVPASAGRRVTRSRDLAVICTQTLEVGADLDFDFLVTETASVRALTQRFGRLNRLGQIADACAVVVHPEDAADQPPYGLEPGQVWERLVGAGEEPNLTPAQIGSVLGTPADVPERAGEFLREHLWEFAKTSYPEPDEPSVELFFDGIDQPAAVVSVCWRSYVPVGDEKLVPPVREDESVEVPIWEAREALADRTVSRLRSDRATVEQVGSERLRSGDQVILQVRDGLYDRSGWNTAAEGCVLDVSVLARPLLWLDEVAVGALAKLSDEDAKTVRSLIRSLTPDEAGELEGDEPEVLDDLLTLLVTAEHHEWLSRDEWTTYVNSLRGRPLTRPSTGTPYVEGERLSRFTSRVELRADALEELSFESQPASLEDHLHAVGSVAARIGEALGLPVNLIEALRAAGRHHDLGKLDPRFQRWLDPDGRTDHPLAKSGQPLARIEQARVASGWPRSGRHELLSVQRTLGVTDTNWPPDVTDLILHLIATHHGQGRSWIRIVAPGADLQLHGMPGGADPLGEADWNQPGRFRGLCSRYGTWGLCLLEAILRQADQAVSAHASGPSVAVL